jgi:hypothetical protein
VLLMRREAGAGSLMYRPLLEKVGQLRATFL